MAYTFDQIIEMAKLSGIPNNPGSTLRPGDRTSDGSKLSHHAFGHAVDFMGYSQDALAEFFMALPTVEVLHYSRATGKSYAKNSKGPYDLTKHPALLKEHENHLHVAMLEDPVAGVLDALRKGIKPVLTAAGQGLSMIGKLIPTPGNVTEALSNVGTAMASGAESLVSIGRVADLVTKAFLPTNILRGFAFMFSLIFILIGIWFLGREVRESTP